MKTGKFRKTNSGICINNFRANGVRKGKYGIAIISNERVCDTVGVFTKNSILAAPISVTKRKIEGGLNAIIANSGNANACVPDGIRDAEDMCKIAGRELNINPANIGVASTGIIGKRVDMKVIADLTMMAARGLSSSPEGSKRAVKAIMTTDTFPKEISVEYRGIKVGGIAKGAGMIAPNMATTLCFMTTNADFDRKKLQTALNHAVEDSFNMLVVDGDMSTNDMVLLMSDRTRKCNFDEFQELLSYAAKELAKMIATDGEGATKFIEVEVRGAKNREDARIGARAIVTSPLIKTAIFGENPNWGRVVAALGSKIKFRFENLDILFESGKRKAVVVKQGRVKNLKDAQKILKNRNIRIIANLNSGKESATAFGCDMGYDYVRINAGYS